MIVCLFDFQGGLLHGFCGVVLLYLFGFVVGVFCFLCLLFGLHSFLVVGWTVGSEFLF